MAHTKVKPSELPEVLRIAEAANQKLFVVSGPGLGKSTIIKQYAGKREFFDTRLAYRSEVDVIGYPYMKADKKGGEMRQHFAVPIEYPTAPGGVWLLDEFTNAREMTQNASLQLLLDNRVGEYQVPENTFVVLAGNRLPDRTNSKRLSSAAVNRVTIVELVPDIDDWTNWAIQNNIDSRIIGFLKFRPDHMLDFEPSNWDGYSAFATPRSWASASRILEQNPSPSLRAAMLGGTVGDKAALEFEGFIRLCDKLPKVEDVFNEPEKTPVPTQPDVLYAITAAIASALIQANKDGAPTGKDKNKTLKNAMTYLARLRKEYEVFGMRMICKGDMKFSLAREFASWCVANKDVIGS